MFCPFFRSISVRLDDAPDETCFNTDLALVPVHEQYPHVPRILVECVELLENGHLLHTTGLYRASGNHTAIQRLRFKINDNNYRLLHEQTDASNLASLVKLFFRELRCPLIKLKQIDQVIGSFESFEALSEKQQIDAVRLLYRSLEPRNRATLKYFIEHIARVERIADNEMNASSLAMVCGACLCYETMQWRTIDALSLSALRLPNRCVELMILYPKSVFGHSDDYVD